ncbi:MAG: glycogen/starch synthase [Saprospiraceae bacterium]|nr:glycogen/starch synthase [Saprospiraceae bacterium]
MKVLHISAECYPAAKSGGLGDVVGALPKYLQKADVSAGVVIPKYRLRWIEEHQFTPIFRGAVRLHNYYVPFTIEKEQNNTLGFPLFVADIPGKFDRPGIYADPSGYTYGDEVERYLSFQQAVLQWIINSPGRPSVLHCHDHHTGLIPFMIKFCPEYRALEHIPTVFTIHNGMYTGAFSWEKMYLLPFFYGEARGLIDWANTINPLASGIKTSWRVTTVSPSYLEELKNASNGMEWLFYHEQHKSLGILNGIDAQVWNPQSDQFIAQRLENGSVAGFKAANKQALAQRFQFDLSLPIITFIGRLVTEKGADLLPDLFSRVLRSGMRVNFLVLGTGDPRIADAFRNMRQQFRGRFDASLEYNEGLAHQLYAGSDFLIMPSRVEPCGLNQMYAMRYGTLPLVRSIGGLRDTVPDIGEPDGSGRGIRFNNFSLEDSSMAIYRAAELYFNQRASFDRIREKIMQIDFSWENSANQYIEVYNQMM